MQQVCALNDSVLLVFNDGHNFFCDVGLPFRMREAYLPSHALVGAPYGSVWEVVGQRSLQRVTSGELIPQSLMDAAVPAGEEVGVEEEEEEEGAGEVGEAAQAGSSGGAGGSGAASRARPAARRDNRNLVDSSSAQAMSADDVLAMRRGGSAGEDIVKALAGSSATFAGKTQFSQEKYLKKKVFKHIRRFRVTRCTAASITDALLAFQPERCGGLRTDSLAAMLAQADVRSGCTALVVDGAQGLLTGAVAERMSSSSSSGAPFAGYIVVAHEGSGGSAPGLQLTQHFNLTGIPGMATGVAAVRFAELVEWAPLIAASAPVAPVAAGAAGASAAGAPASASAAAAAAATTTAAPAPTAHPQAAGAKRAREDTPTPSSTRRLTPFPYSQAALQHLLGRGVDSLLLAPNLDTLSGGEGALPALALSALRYVRPSGSFAIFALSPLPLAHLAAQLKAWNVATNVQLAETWTREQQVLPGRTHPHMSMHGASGFVLSGTVVGHAWSCVHMSLRAPAPRKARERKSAVVGGGGGGEEAQQQAQQLRDVGAMRLACEQAALCPRSDKGYSVGAVIAETATGTVVCVGHSREVEASALRSSSSDGSSSSSSGGDAAPASSGVHAEEVALWRLQSLLRSRAAGSAPLPPLTLYSTMEPCSRRLSGSTCCAALVLRAAASSSSSSSGGGGGGGGISRVVVAVPEPSAFVADCRGLEVLRSGGMAVHVLEDSECRERALQPNRHLAPPADKGGAL